MMTSGVVDAMADYTPHNWVVVNITSNGETFNKVLAGWSGGYLDGDTWRMNSGITAVGKDGSDWLFYGASGSVYRCDRDRYGVRGDAARALNNILSKNSDTVNSVVLDKNTDWRSIAMVKGDK
jgi:hypothetical protein